MQADPTGADAATLLDRWRDDLAAWAIPEPIMRAAGPKSPWELPRQVFVDRTRRQVAVPSGHSYQRAVDALGPGGTVLDVGCGAGAASLPLAPRASGIVGVDSQADMLDAVRTLGAELGCPVETVAGRWPDVAGQVGPADVVVCYNVVYNVGDLGPFVLELTRHARRRVVVELTARHPMSDLNPLWRRLHGLVRPERPTASDAVAALRAMGLPVRAHAWTRPAVTEFATYQDMLAVTGQRLCLPPERLPDLDVALRELGVDPDHPRLGTPARAVVTVWWPPQ
jgi:SAM-dependent methyltransferase